MRSTLPPQDKQHLKEFLSVFPETQVGRFGMKDGGGGRVKIQDEGALISCISTVGMKSIWFNMSNIYQNAPRQSDWHLKILSRGDFCIFECIGCMRSTVPPRDKQPAKKGRQRRGFTTRVW